MLLSPPFWKIRSISEIVLSQYARELLYESVTEVCMEDGDEEGEEVEPLNTDDVGGEDPTELFDANNVIVCQIEKVTGHISCYVGKLVLKDGIMNLDGADNMFQKDIDMTDW
ncbi:Transcription initiation factor IIA subunit 1 [Mactra antiquata]